MRILFTDLQPWQNAAINSQYTHFCMYAGISCLRGDSRVQTIKGLVRIDSLKAGTKVLSITNHGPVWAKCNAPYVKGRARLYRVVHEHGEFVAHGNHLVCDVHGNWQYVHTLRDQQEILGCPSGYIEGALHYQKNTRRLSGELFRVQPSIWSTTSVGNK